MPRYRNAPVASPAAAPRDPRCPPAAGLGTRRVLEASSSRPGQGARVIVLDQRNDAWLRLVSAQLSALRLARQAPQMGEGFPLPLFWD